MSTDNDDGILLRMPVTDDGYQIHRLIAESPPLDVNSVYCYYLLCDHFRETCVVAEHDNKVAGFLSAYRIPKRDNTLFVWQVVVSRELRGHHIASRMLDEVLSRFDGDSVAYVESTVNPSNTPSRGLFERLARQRGTLLEDSTFLEASAFGSESEHESEILLRIPLYTE
ncbi:MAG: diaminobutyrate acetyltransferase [Gammaproteobacteria bacterium]|jgi:L-2,4-diaminobutyric acid acetyltransferase